MTPSTPGTYRVRYDDGRTADYVVEMGTGSRSGVLCVTWEVGNPYPMGGNSVQQFTEILETVGGRWVV